MALQVTETDFVKIKDNLKAFLAAKPEFADFNFAGSAINTLLDLLAYSTHYNAVYANLGFNELYLDTLQQPGSAYSKAKELNYLPASVNAPYAVVRLNFTVTGNPQIYTIPQGTRFQATAADNTTYTFVFTEDVSVEIGASNTYTILTQIFQGVYATYSYTADLTDQSQRFIVPSFKADIRFLSVTVNGTPYNRFEPYRDVGTINGTSEIFFLTKAFDAYYEVGFGDNILGQAIANGDVINLSYLVTQADVANGLTNFTLLDTLPNVTSFAVSVVAPAQGGAQAESVDSIKFNAPFVSQSNNRSVTAIDFAALLKENYPEIEDAVSWGGQENVPPSFGKVFAAIKPIDGTVISDTQKAEIVTFMTKNYNIVNLTPVLVDPSYITFIPAIVATYDARTLGNTDLSALIKMALTGFFSENLSKFDKALYYSKLQSALDSAHPSIIDLILNYQLMIGQPIFPGVSASYTYNFNNAIQPGAIFSNTFQINGVNYLLRDVQSKTDPTTGTLQIYTGNTNTVLNDNAGTVNYNTGVISLLNVTINTIPSDPINLILNISVSPGAVIDPANPDTIYRDLNVYTNSRDQMIILASNPSVNIIAG